MAEASENEGRIWTCVCGDNKTVSIEVGSLVKYSGYFEAMMHSQMRETTARSLDLQLITSDTLKLVLQLLSSKLNQTQCCDLKMFENIGVGLDFETIECVLRAADYLDILCLNAICSELLSTNVESLCVHIDSLQKVWDLCTRYNLESSKEVVCTHLAANFSKLESNDNMFFCKVPVDVLKGVLALPDINLSSEIDVMKCIVDWIAYSRGDRMQHFDTLFKFVHISALDLTELDHIDALAHSLELNDFTVGDYVAEYMENPHKYLLSHPEHNNIRNIREILMTFGGVFKDVLRPHNIELGYQRRRTSEASVPAMYVELGEDRLKHHMITQTSSSHCPSSKRKTKQTPDCGLDGFRTMPKLRTPATSTLIEFGVCLHENFVYLVGGQKEPNIMARSSVKEAHRLDPHHGEWHETSHMKEARCLFCLCSVWERLYAIGGANQFGVLRSTEYYIPLMDKWYRGPQLVTELHEHAGCAFQNKLYISGGHTDTEHTDSVWVLETKEETWKQVASLLTPRSYHAMTSVGDKMYVVGGCQEVSSRIKDLFSVEQYDPLSDSWTHILTLNVPVCCCTPVVIDNKILFVGGYSFDEEEYLYDTVLLDVQSGAWTSSHLKTNSSKKIVGFSCLKLKVNRKMLKLDCNKND